MKASPAPQAPVTGIRYCASCLAVYRQDFQRCPLDGGQLTIGATDPWIGMTVGAHYVIDGFVGEGAMGRVYRAHRDNVPDRQYAIKVLIGDLAATAQMRARFALEAENASKLAHPNVVNVVDFGVTDAGVNYIVMDLVQGPSLGAICLEGPMEPDRVIRIARQLCEGLEHAHGRGMIHRDFKPDNILVVGDGELEVARIADFGLAICTTNETRLTTTGVVCTPAYAAPEQLRGQTIDHRVDLYALGTTMFEMLSGGILPFNGDLDHSVASKLAGDAPSVLLVAPNVPPALVSIVGRLLSVDPEKRPRSARAVIRALDAAMAAPRQPMPTDKTTPLEPIAQIKPLKKSSPEAARAVKANAPSERRNVKLSESTERAIEELLPSPRRRFRRTLLQMLAVGITLGGAIAWIDLRSPLTVEHAQPTIDMVSAPVTTSVADSIETETTVDVDALRSAANDFASAVSLPHSEPAPVLEPAPSAAPIVAPPPEPAPAPREMTVQKKSPVVQSRARKPVRRHRVVEETRPTPAMGAELAVLAAATPAAAELIAPTFEDPAQTTTSVTANALAIQYGAIGRELRKLDKQIGRENTNDLWAAYRVIHISAAMESQALRDEAAEMLSMIHEAIVDRRP